MDRVSWRRRLEFVAFQSIVCLVDMLPPRTAFAWADNFAWFICRVLPRKFTRYHVARENLAIAFGEQLADERADEIILDMWRHCFRLVVEMVQAPRRLHLHSYRRHIEFTNHRPFVNAALSGRRLLIVTGHCGNWEACTTVLGLWDLPFGLVARELDNPLLERWFARRRAAERHRLLHKKGGYDGMQEILTRGGGIALLGDQDAGPRGMFVDFFGRPASTFKSIALLALEYDALLVVGASLRCARPDAATGWSRFAFGAEEVIDPREIAEVDAARAITQRFTHAIERLVRRAPGQYFWLHRRWKHQPKTAARKGEAAA